ncbi:MAG TPA: acyl-CoA dehydrogenase family protein [Acidimicrobiia bacterium]|nr:acyl-CoA dehydrogenase family protein [Acidimicrobiia bacterium]
MDFDESPEHEAFRHQARSWLAEHAPDPLPLELEATQEELEFRRRWAKQLAAAGYAGIDWPEEYGGAGRTFAERLIWTEEWARARCPEAFEDSCDQLGSTLLASATPEQCARYMPPMLVGDETWCQGFSEPDAGSDLAALQTRAEPGPGGRFRITGQKVWTSNAHWANWCYVLARTSDDRYRGITFFLVPMDQPGIEVRPLRQISGEAHFAEVFFDRAEAQEIVGDVGAGWTVAMTTLTHERFTRSFRVRTHLRNDLDDLRAASEPVTDASHRQELARLETAVAIFRWTLLRDQTDLEAGRPIGNKGSLHKLMWANTDQALFELASRMGGLERLTGDSHWIRHYYWTRAESIFAGSNEIQRNLIAERILGLPR